MIIATPVVVEALEVEVAVTAVEALEVEVAVTAVDGVETPDDIENGVEAVVT